MELFNTKTIFFLVILIIIICVLGLGYLEIKTLKIKIDNLEKISIKNKNNFIYEDIPKKSINNDNFKHEKLCIICNINKAEPSSKSKYHNLYCIYCSEKDNLIESKKNNYINIKNKINEINNNNNTSQEKDKINPDNTNYQDNNIYKNIDINAINDKKIIKNINLINDQIHIKDKINLDNANDESNSDYSIDDGSDSNISIDDNTYDNLDNDTSSENMSIKNILISENQFTDENTDYDILEKFNVKKLKSILKNNNLIVSGTKNILIKRIIDNNIDFN